MTQKHIIIDARLYGPRHTGLGRYTKNLLIALTKTKLFSHYRFTLLVYPELEKEIKKDLGTSYNYQVTNIRHYTLREQLLLPLILYRLKPHLVHFTHLDKPILFFSKSVVTVHDLIRHFSKGQDTTTKNPIFYWLKYLGYLFMSWFVIRFNNLIVPSNFWRNYIISNFHISPDKIVTTYEAVDPILANLKTNKLLKPQNYLVYTGNLYPHKNIKIVLESLKYLPNIKLKIICARDIFASRLKKLVIKMKLERQIDFLGYIPDSKFKNIYSHAIALVHPALLEGFSLTGLEAMALNCPVISSTSSCLPEIYQNSVLYFDAHDPIKLASQISKLIDNPQFRLSLINRGTAQVQKYSWINTANLTINFYHHLIS